MENWNKIDGAFILHQDENRELVCLGEPSAFEHARVANGLSPKWDDALTDDYLYLHSDGIFFYLRDGDACWLIEWDRRNDADIGKAMDIEGKQIDMPVVMWLEDEATVKKLLEVPYSDYFKKLRKEYMLMQGIVGDNMDAVPLFAELDSVRIVEDGKVVPYKIDYPFLFDRPHNRFWHEAQKIWVNSRHGKHDDAIGRLPIGSEAKAELKHLLAIDGHWHSYIDWRERNPDKVEWQIARLRDRLKEYKGYDKLAWDWQIADMKEGLDKTWPGISKRDAEIIHCTDRHILVRIKTANGFFKAAHGCYGTYMGLCTAAHRKELREMWHLYYAAKVESFDVFVFDRDGYDPVKGTPDTRKTFVQRHIFNGKTNIWNRMDEPTDKTGKINEWLLNEHRCDFDLEGYLSNEQEKLRKKHSSKAYAETKRKKLLEFERLNKSLVDAGIIGFADF